MIVVDASAAVDLFCATDDRRGRIGARVAAASTLHVPALFDLEVMQSLRGLEAGRVVPDDILEAALDDLVDLRAIRHRHELLRPRVWALRHNLSAYDAAYVALAELLEAPLLTSDAALARSAGHEATIEQV
ncbi:MAG: type II toxin-antitoxin system VapC family toxin [Solirubrobacterales bacterium]